MYLKSLELFGFKSFAKKSNLLFNSSITGIVGPNGSGKSNVAEAFRFVLGEQSIKSLRGKRGEDLIWNGGGESGRANRAHIRLVFDNTSRIFPNVDFDEVSIERAVYRDGVNEYSLNGSLVRLKDIVEMLASAHIGATGHHIISQGEADRILSASPRERREMIEDALGLKIYQWKKTESLKKLEKTDENMKQVESLRREIAPHLKFLKKQVEKVEKAALLRSELVLMYKKYFRSEDEYIKKERDRLQSLLRGPREEMTNLESNLDKAKQVLANSKSRDQKSDKVITVENKLGSVRREKDSVMRELGRLEGEIQAYVRSIEKEKEKQKRDEFKTIYLKDLDEVIATIETFSAETDTATLFSKVKTVLRSFVEKHRTVTDSALVDEASREISSLTQKKKAMEDKLQSLNTDEHSFVIEYAELKAVIEKEKDTDREAEKDVFKIIARQNEVRAVISGLEEKMDMITREEDIFKKELSEAGMSLGRDAISYDTEILVPEWNDENWRKEIMHSIERIKVRLEDAGASGGSEIMKEYKETEERDAFLAKELNDLEKAKDELMHLIKDLDIRIDYEFKSGILKVNAQFEKYFILMFGGGRAELTLVKEEKRKRKSDVEDLSEAISGEVPNENEEEENALEGLEVNVSLPRKKVKGLMMLSGGERALTSIALLFAISQVNPPPFIILDETDAALDEANSRKYGDMIENLSHHSQLILITHNRETMSRAGVLYGVTMGSDGASRLLSIAFEQAVVVAK